MAIYEHEDEETRRMLRFQIEVQQRQIQQLDGQLGVMLGQMEVVMGLAVAGANKGVSEMPEQVVESTGA